VMYSLTCLVSISGLGCGLWGWYIARTAPFTKNGRAKPGVLEGYEDNFLGMQSVIVFLGINVLVTAANFHLALRGKQSYIWLLNMVYDFFIWALFIGFGVLNMVIALWDRRLCDGNSEEDRKNYEKCDTMMFRLLVVELVAINLGILAAVFHFILLIARCCTFGRMVDRDRAVRLQSLKSRIAEEEGMLMELMLRRRALLEENEELVARRISAERPLPPVPTEESAGAVAETLAPQEEQREEDLIDMAGNGQGEIGE